jgi:hypothetical protein
MNESFEAGARSPKPADSMGVRSSDLIIIFGPPASGKAAVGRALAELTRARFFHNHMTAEPVAALFGWGTEAYTEVAAQVRLLLLSKALTPGAPDVIFTFVWAFNLEADNRFIRDLVAAAESRGARIHFVELKASRAARIAREGTPLRLELKPAKRDVERARAYHAEIDARHTMNSAGDFPYAANHLIIDTETVTPNQAAARIKDRFLLPVYTAS